MGQVCSNTILTLILWQELSWTTANTKYISGTSQIRSFENSDAMFSVFSYITESGSFRGVELSLYEKRMFSWDFKASLKIWTNRTSVLSRLKLCSISNLKNQSSLFDVRYILRISFIKVFSNLNSEVAEFTRLWSLSSLIF